jgi:hypothetical protein
LTKKKTEYLCPDTVTLGGHFVIGRGQLVFVFIGALLHGDQARRRLRQFVFQLQLLVVGSIARGTDSTEGSGKDKLYKRNHEKTTCCLELPQQTDARVPHEIEFTRRSGKLTQ